MPRGLHASVETAVNSASLRAELAVEFSFDAGAIRLWTGLGSITFSSKTFTGNGQFHAAQDFKETSDLRASGVQFTLSGIDLALIATALAEDFQGRACTAWLLILDSSGAIVGSAVQIFSGRMDTMEIDEAGETSSITVAVENALIDLDRARDRRYTHEDQKIDFPNDRGLEYLVSFQNRNVGWGGGTIEVTPG